MGRPERSVRPGRRCRPGRAVRPFLIMLPVAMIMLVVAGVGPAAAHNTLVSTVPAPEQSVAAVPGEIVLTFNEPAIALGTQVVVTGPGGPVQAGTPRLVDATVRQSLQPGAPAGAYRVDWRVTSADGHPISGSYAFTAESAGTGEAPAPTTEPAPSRAGGVAVWLTIAGAALVLLAAVLVLRRLRR